MSERETPNVLLIVSDQHNPRITGYAGHPHVATPNLDALAARGAVFTRACCTSPVCGPSRMSYLTGKHLHQIRNWWNAVPLDPDEMTWARRLDEAGIESTLLGKIDAAGACEAPGFSRYALSMRRKAYDPYPRDEPPRHMVAGATRPASRAYLDRAGAFDPETVERTEHGYNPAHGLYFQDSDVLKWTKDYLREKGASPSGEPWALHVGFEYPHWPYVCPEEYFRMYYPDKVALPRDAVFQNNEALPPALREWQRWNDLGEVPEETLRRTLAAYCGMVTCMDGMIGEILAELEAQGQAENTLVIYTSDHGESLGEHGCFFKHSPGAASVGVPLLMAGPGVPAGCTVQTPVSLVELYPTLLGVCGLEAEPDRPGRSYFDHFGPDAPRRDSIGESILAEWHGPGFAGAWYMLMNARYKYVWFESFPPVLYDIAEDPNEDRDLAGEPAYARILAAFERELRNRLDPEAVSMEAKRDLGLIAPGGRDLSRPAVCG
jgi:choline-sulfatase